MRGARKKKGRYKWGKEGMGLSPLEIETELNSARRARKLSALILSI